MQAPLSELIFERDCATPRADWDRFKELVDRCEPVDFDVGILGERTASIAVLLSADGLLGERCGETREDSCRKDRSAGACSAFGASRGQTEAAALPDDTPTFVDGLS